MSEQPLKPLIDKLLRAYGYQDQLDEMDLVAAYEELVGKMYCKHTKSINFKNKILYVKLDSAALKQELSYKREEIITQLNQKLGRRIVEQLDIK